MLAAMHGNMEIIPLLLEAGADPNITTNEGETPLQRAENLGHTRVVEALKGAEGE